MLRGDGRRRPAARRRAGHRQVGAAARGRGPGRARRPDRPAGRRGAGRGRGAVTPGCTSCSTRWPAPSSRSRPGRERCCGPRSVTPTDRRRTCSRSRVATLGAAGRGGGRRRAARGRRRPALDRRRDPRGARFVARRIASVPVALLAAIRPGFEDVLIEADMPSRDAAAAPPGRGGAAGPEAAPGTGRATARRGSLSTRPATRWRWPSCRSPRAPARGRRAAAGTAVRRPHPAHRAA